MTTHASKAPKTLEDIIALYPFHDSCKGEGKLAISIPTHYIDTLDKLLSARATELNNRFHRDVIDIDLSPGVEKPSSAPYRVTASQAMRIEGIEGDAGFSYVNVVFDLDAVSLIFGKEATRGFIEGLEITGLDPDAVWKRLADRDRTPRTQATSTTSHGKAASSVANPGPSGPQ